MPTCNSTTLVDQVADLAKLQSLGQTQAALIYLKALQVAASGGTNYLTGTFPVALNVAAAAYSKYNDAQRETALLAIAQQNAIAAGATVPTDTNDWQVFIKQIQNSPDPAAMLLAVECGLT